MNARTTTRVRIYPYRTPNSGNAPKKCKYVNIFRQFHLHRSKYVWTSTELAILSAKWPNSSDHQQAAHTHTHTQNACLTSKQSIKISPLSVPGYRRRHCRRSCRSCRRSSETAAAYSAPPTSGCPLRYPPLDPVLIAWVSNRGTTDRTTRHGKKGELI